MNVKVTYNENHLVKEVEYVEDNGYDTKKTSATFHFGARLKTETRILHDDLWKLHSFGGKPSFDNIIEHYKYLRPSSHYPHKMKNISNTGVLAVPVFGRIQNWSKYGVRHRTNGPAYLDFSTERIDAGVNQTLEFWYIEGENISTIRIEKFLKEHNIDKNNISPSEEAFLVLTFT